MHITVVGIVEATITYIIVRSIVWCLKQAEYTAEREFKNEYQKRAYNHIHKRHIGKPVDCPDCATIVTVDELAI